MDRPDGMPEIQFAAIAELAVGRRGRMRAYVFELASAVGFPIQGLAYLIDPGGFAFRSALGERVYPFDFLWSVGYVMGGCLILAGILWPQLRLRVAGLILLGTALVLQCLAAFGVAPQLRDAFTGVYALACFVKALLLTRLYRIYQATPRTDGSDASGSQAA